MAVTFVGAAQADGGATSGATYSTDFSALSLVDGDYLIFTIMVEANTTTFTGLSGWTQRYAADVVGSRSVYVYDRVWHTGDAKTLSYVKSRANSDGNTVAAYRGVSTGSIIYGTGKTRAGAPADTGTTTTALSITTATANTTAILISAEATLNAETAPFNTGPTTPSGWTQDYYKAQATTIQTLAFLHKDMATAGATGNATLTYQQSQGSNSWATQIGLPPVAGANVAPVANFSYSANDTVVQFTDTSTDSDGSIASRSWNFGDGTTSTATNPKKTFNKAGTYSVSLTVTDNGGATNTKTQSITVTGVTVHIWNGTAWREAHLKKDINGVTTAAATVTGEFGTRPNWTQTLAKTTPIFGAHRGFSGNYPEMTMRAYNAATILWKDQVDFLEISVQFDSQGVAWGLHDSTVNRTAGGPTGALSSFTTAQVAAMNVYPSGTDNQTAPPAPMLKLTDMLARFGGKIPIMIEDKTYTHTDAIISLMNANGGPEWYIWKQSGNGNIFSQVNTNGYRSWGYYFDGGDMTVFPTNHTQWTFVGVDFNSSDATLTSAVATAGNYTDGRSRVIGHIIPNATQKNRMLGFGMRGLMVSSGRLALPRF